MATYRDLLVWQKAMSLVIEVYKLSGLLPPEEKYGLSDQMKRAAVSIPSNIAEGQGRDSRNEFIRFLSIAQGSRAELETQLEICVQLNYIPKENLKTAETLSEELRKMIIALQNSMKTKQS